MCEQNCSCVKSPGSKMIITSALRINIHYCIAGSSNSFPIFSKSNSYMELAVNPGGGFANLLLEVLQPSICSCSSSPGLSRIRVMKGVDGRCFQVVITSCCGGSYSPCSTCASARSWVFSIEILKRLAIALFIRNTYRSSCYSEMTTNKFPLTNLISWMNQIWQKSRALGS